MNVADSNARFINLAAPLFRDTHTVIDHLNRELAVVAAGPHRDNAAFHFRCDPVPDSILHQRLQNHAGHEHIQGSRFNFFADLQLVPSEAHHLDIQIVIDEIQFLLERHKMELRL